MANKYESLFNHRLWTLQKGCQNVVQPVNEWASKHENNNMYRSRHTILQYYLITVQHLSNVHNVKLNFIWLAKKDNLMLLNWWTMVNDQYQFECSTCEWNDSFWFSRTVIRYSRVHMISKKTSNKTHAWMIFEWCWIGCECPTVSSDFFLKRTSDWQKWNLSFGCFCQMQKVFRFR